jgi:hypothetical protein
MKFHYRNSFNKYHWNQREVVVRGGLPSVDELTVIENKVV